MFSFIYPPPHTTPGTENEWEGAVTNGRQALLFISPAGGVKRRLAATIRAASAGRSRSCVGFFLELPPSDGFGVKKQKQKSKMVFRKNSKASFVPVVSSAPRPDTQSPRQRAPGSSLRQPPPLTPTQRNRTSLVPPSAVSRVTIPGGSVHGLPMKTPEGVRGGKRGF